jgi:hypothetical protein
LIVEGAVDRIQAAPHGQQTYATTEVTVCPAVGSTTPPTCTDTPAPVSQLGSTPSYTAYRVHLDLIPAAAALNVYAIFGDTDNPMIVPKAWQDSQNLLGTNVGGISPTIIQISHTTAYDSWLTVRIYLLLHLTCNCGD